jgi:hypothetical protein
MASGTSKRGRKRRPVQQELFRRGGKRRGAGRKPNGPRAGERHQARPDFKASHPLHVMVRVAPAVGSLRRRKLYKAMRDATITAALREWFPGKLRRARSRVAGPSDRAKLLDSLTRSAVPVHAGPAVRATGYGSWGWPSSARAPAGSAKPVTWESCR